MPFHTRSHTTLLASDLFLGINKFISIKSNVLKLIQPESLFCELRIVSRCAFLAMVRAPFLWNTVPDYSFTLSSVLLCMLCFVANFYKFCFVFICSVLYFVALFCMIFLCCFLVFCFVFS